MALLLAHGIKPAPIGLRSLFRLRLNRVISSLCIRLRSSGGYDANDLAYILPAAKRRRGIRALDLSQVRIQIWDRVSS
jgi:hypothetical protein